MRDWTTHPTRIRPLKNPVFRLVMRAQSSTNLDPELTQFNKMTQNPLILAVETSGRIGSVAIAQGPTIVQQVSFSGVMKHSAEIFPAIRGILQQLGQKPSQIRHVYISAGPGSFTGLRIAVALAKSMHLANEAKIISVDTLDVIAENATDYIVNKNDDPIKNIAAVLDAKRGQYYMAAYRVTGDCRQNPIYNKILSDCLITPAQFIEQVAEKDPPVWLLGEGLLYHRDIFQNESIEFFPQELWQPQAANVHKLGWQKAQQGDFADPLTLQPFYLRRPEAEEKWQGRKHDGATRS
jgi:tRNA threonylcarbamoyladenosine biosynthesis protein TsaB